MTDWDPVLYRQFEAERTRPALELLGRIPVTHPTRVTDLGCGPGNSTELLRQHWPDAQIIGLDNSPAMLVQARERLPDCFFVESDIQRWHPQSPQQIIYANASLQWVENHNQLIPHLVRQLAPEGVLAIQMPDNVNEPSHRLMREIAVREPFSQLIPAAIVERKQAFSTEHYYDLLTQNGCQVDIWRTTYFHVMPTVSAIVDWLRSTGLRPFLAQLNQEQQRLFLDAYLSELKNAYPQRADGRVLLAFPRFFIVAVKSV
ncbi:trans-aconitate 2-methyltransferase [Pantoea sp. A4]|uniref:trans-aconitate 2-methyltransferase n=1 Tax=Pantoea sp. A4 TaxID=1225184 RepID=UPI000474A96E|nr:trans-aconitate 2-methyltransferase [Pantoea sp. A4]